MSLEKAKEYLKKWNLEDRVKEFSESSATVELAAKAIGCEPEHIAKTLSFQVEDNPVLIVASGDAKIDNTKFKEQFHTKAKMLSKEEVKEKIGHAVGGVCPFGVNEGVRVYLDISLRRFKTIYPACGSSNSVVKMTVEELETCSKNLEWIDVCKGWQENS